MLQELQDTTKEGAKICNACPIRDSIIEFEKTKGESMKTMFVVASNRVNNHVGEEYDEIIEVVNEPTTENIQYQATIIMPKIEVLWHQVMENDEDAEKKVVVHLDAASPFAVMLMNLKIIMGRNGVVIDLPWEQPDNIDGLDSESREVLKKLGHNNETKN